jgi:predicted phage terminase large subunit-like protein
MPKKEYVKKEDKRELTSMNNQQREIYLNKYAFHYENLKAVKKELLMRSYYHFFKWAFKILIPNEPYVDAPHVKYLCDLLQSEVERMERNEEKTKDIIVNIPPRTSKSLIFSIIFPAWVWTRIPSNKFITISYDDALTLLNASQNRDLIESDEYQELFGSYVSIRHDSNAKSLFENTRGGRRVSKTTGSNITGMGSSIINIDDPENPITVMSEVKREQTQTYYGQSLYNRLTPANLGIRIIVQQRLHEEDLSGYLLNRSPNKYLHINLPAVLSDDVSPPECKEFYKDGLLDPNRLGWKVLDDMKEALGSYGYSSQYLMKPIPVEGGILKRSWFNILEPENVSRDTQKSPIHFFLDTAYTDKTANDPTAIMAAFRKGNEIYIIRAEEKWLEFPDLIKYVKDFVFEYGYTSDSKIYVEPKASGKSVVQMIKDETDLNIIEDEAPDVDKITRLFGISPIVESRRVNIINGGWTENFMAQVCSISPDYKPKHDDMADTLIIAIRRMLVENDFDFGFL